MRGMSGLGLAVVALLICNGAAMAAELDPFGFSEDDYSLWGITDAAYPYDPADAGKPNGYGCFPVGNGLVFAHLGVDSDFNTLRGIIGPGYQTRNDAGGAEYWKAGEWPDIRIMTDRWHEWNQGQPPEESEPVVISSQSIQQVRGAAIVRTVQESTAGTLYGQTYAVPGIPAIIREFAFEPAASGKQVLIQLELADAEVEVDGNDLVVNQNGSRLTVQCRQLVAVEDRYLLMWESDANGIKRAALAVMATGPGEPRPALELDAEMVATYRRRALEHWHDWSAQTRLFDTGDARLDDMLIQLPVIIETQRDAYSGGCSPMVSYHGYWVRDSLGPMLAYIDNGRFEEVMRMLRYHRAACLKYKSCHMLVPLDLDLSDLPGWEPEEPYLSLGGMPKLRGMDEPTAGNLAMVGIARADWEGVPVEHAEVPSLIVLQHYLLWRALTEAGRGEEADTFIREAWPFITHNLFAMKFHDDYGAYFHGDETYTQGALYSTYDREESGAIGFPNGYIPTDGFCSFDNTLLHWSAALAVQEMAADQGDRQNAQKLAWRMQHCLERYKHAYAWQGNGLAPAISTVTGQLWPQPFSNISLGEYSLTLNHSGSSIDLDTERFMIGELTAGQYSAAKTWLHQPAAWEEAGRPRLSWWTTPWSGFATGHALGTWLNAARNNRDSVACAEILTQLLATATPEGAWCEVYDQHGDPVNIYGRVNRIRPWESGINYAMLAAYLAGQGLLAPDAESSVNEETLQLLTDDYTRDHEFWEKVERWQSSPRYSPSWFGFYTADGSSPWLSQVPEGTQALVLTVKPDWLERVRKVPALAAIPQELIAAWDVALPFTPQILREALLAMPVGEPSAETIAPRIPCLYIDDGIERGRSRRTFKDAHFWQDVDAVITDYLAAGGQAFGDLGAGVKPPWELELGWVEDDAGWHIRVAMPEGPAGRYTVTATAHTADTTIMRELTQRGLFATIDWDATLKLAPGAELFIEFQDTDAEFIEQLRSLPIEFTVTQDGTGFTFKHVIPPDLSRVEFLKSRLPDGGSEDIIPRAHSVSPVLDGKLDDWPGAPSLTLTPATGQSWTGGFDGPDDASVTLWLGYDKDKLYAAAMVRDDALPEGGTWSSDRINLVLDARLDTTAGNYPVEGTSHQNWQADDYWAFLAPFADAGKPVMMRLGGEQPGGGKGYFGDLIGAEAVAIKENDGYTCEWAIPLSSLPYLDPQPGAFAGFTFFYTDFDDVLGELMFLTNWGSTGDIEWRFWDCGLLYFER